MDTEFPSVAVTPGSESKLVAVKKENESEEDHLFKSIRGLRVANGAG